MSLSAASKANFLTHIFLPAITCHFETRPLLPLLTFISCSRQPDHTALVCLFSDIDLHKIICNQTKSNIKNTSISTIKSTNIVLQRNFVILSIQCYDTKFQCFGPRTIFKNQNFKSKTPISKEILCVLSKRIFSHN